MEIKEDLKTNEDLQGNALSQNEVPNQELYIILKLAKWSKTLAIILTVTISSMVLIIILMKTSPSLAIGLMFVFLGLFFSTQNAIAALFFFIPTYHLFQFSKQVKNMNDLSDKFQISAAFKSLHSFFKSLAIISLVIFIIKLLYPLAFLL